MLQRFAAASGTPSEVRLLAELDGVQLVATHSRSDTLDPRLAPGERLLLRRRA